MTRRPFDNPDHHLPIGMIPTNPYSATEIAKQIRHGKMRIAHNILQDTADLFELTAIAAGARGDISAVSHWARAQGDVLALMERLHERSETTQEAGRRLWLLFRDAIEDGVATGRVDHNDVVKMRALWSTTPTQDEEDDHRAQIETPPTGYHAALDTIIRNTFTSAEIAASGSPDPYNVAPFKIEAIQSDTPSGFPLKGFTLTETRPADEFGMSVPFAPADPLLTTLTRIRDTLTELVDATSDEPNPLHDILVHAANMTDDAVIQRTHDQAHPDTPMTPAAPEEYPVPTPLRVAPAPIPNALRPGYGHVGAYHVRNGTITRTPGDGLNAVAGLPTTIQPNPMHLSLLSDEDKNEE